MCASPSKIPTNTSFISLGSVIEALSNDDKRVTPFVERAANNNITPGTNKGIIVVEKLSMLIT
jgi:hypothetical protein